MTERLHWVPIKRYAAGWFGYSGDAWAGIFNGQPGWTDGNVMLIGLPPVNAFVKGQRDFSRPLTQANRPGLSEIRPVAVAELGTLVSVIFSDGHIFDAKYYNLIHGLWPEAKWFGDSNSRATPGYPVNVTNKGRQVALVTALKPGDYEMDIQEVLQRANAVPSQPAIQGPEEPQPKKETV